VIEGLQQGVELAEQHYKGLVIWSGDEPFSAGADLQSMLPAFMIAGVDAIEGAEHELQQLMLRLRYARCPWCRPRGMALGGGCELAVHSARRVAPWKATSAWWKWAWAWCPAPAA
jgi:3-hydroxyacyl-CoA dehydrogenase